MSFKQNTQFNRGRKATKRVLIGETREEEAARLEKEIAAHRKEDNAEGLNERLGYSAANEISTVA